MNKVILIGFLGSDPDSRTTGSGLSVANLSVATNDRRKNSQGEWEDATEWHRVVCFGKVAENAARYLAKGRQVAIEGKLRTRKWTDKEGVDKWSTEILADSVQFIGGSGNKTSATPDGYRTNEPDDIPF